MYTVSSNKENLVEINKSKFIGFLINVNNLDDINKHIKKIKDKYSDATHICYAYKIDNIERFSDDKEPSGTAGKPILELLKKNSLDHTLAIVVRYFGGIKLGASNLLRAYVSTINELIKESDLKPLIDLYKIRFKISYDKLNYVEKLNIHITYKEFDELIILEALVNDDSLNIIKNISDDVIILDKIKSFLP